MAITITVEDMFSLGNKKCVLGKFAFDTNYSGGYTITPQKFGFTYIDKFFCESTAGYTFDYVKSTGVLHCYSTAATEVSGNLSSALAAVDFMVIGS